MNNQQLPCAPHLDRGASLSVLVAGAMVALLVVMGLVIDGGAQASARARAQSVASQAARAGADAFGAARVIGAGDVSAARLAAQRVLTHQGVEGTVDVQDAVVVVHTRIRVPTVFLNLIGVDELVAQADSRAQLAPR